MKYWLYKLAMAKYLRIVEFGNRDSLMYKIVNVIIDYTCNHPSYRLECAFRMDEFEFRRAMVMSNFVDGS